MYSFLGNCRAQAGKLAPFAGNSFAIFFPYHFDDQNDRSLKRCRLFHHEENKAQATDIAR